MPKKENAKILYIILYINNVDRDKGSLFHDIYYIETYCGPFIVQILRMWEKYRQNEFPY